MTQFDAFRRQRFLERKRAADHEAHQVVAPEFTDVLWLGNELAVFPDPVARQVGADVEILAQFRHARIAGRRHSDQRAGLWIELAEAKEVGCQRLRQNGKIALHISRREAGGRSAVSAGADRAPRRKTAFLVCLLLFS